MGRGARPDSATVHNVSLSWGKRIIESITALYARQRGRSRPTVHGRPGGHHERRKRI